MRTNRSAAIISGVAVLGLMLLIGAMSLPGPASVSAASENGSGTIQGKIKSPYARLAEGIAYIKEVPGRQFKLPEKAPAMDQKNKMFTPHLLPVLVGTTVDFPNTDDVRHSVYSLEGSASDFNLGQYESGVVKQVKFADLGNTQLACNVHAEMSAVVLALQNPYFSLTSKKDGSFLISDVPAGTWEITFFHEKIQETSLEVTVEAGKESVVEFTKLKRKR